MRKLPLPLAVVGVLAFGLANHLGYDVEALVDRFSSGGVFEQAAGIGQTYCPEHYAYGTPPMAVRSGLEVAFSEVCKNSFAAGHSGATRTPLWTAHLLRGLDVVAARSIERVDTFHPENVLGSRHRAELEDYRGSGYDRGHLVPAADMPTAAALHESFSLANIVPQDPEANRGVWARVEMETRRLAEAYGEMHVVTGPIFAAEFSQTVGGRVAVPTHVFKAVYVPSQQAASAWVVTNDGSARGELLSISELADRIGADPFPAVAAGVKDQLVGLPTPW